jgi:putative ABC transport system permease protein
MSIRLAIGASRGAVVRQLLTESAVMADPGGLAGLAVASVTIRLLFRRSDETARRLQLVTAFLDSRVWRYTLGVSVGDRRRVRPAACALRHAPCLSTPGLKSGAASAIGGHVRFCAVCS